MSYQILDNEMCNTSNNCQAWFTLGIKVYKMDLEMCRLVEQPWLQLMCCTVCLSHGCNFQWKERVQNESESRSTIVVTQREGKKRIVAHMEVANCC